MKYILQKKEGNTRASGELHLLVLWHNARTDEQRILQDVSKKLRILSAYELKWTPEKVLENFKRFYGCKLSQAMGKVTECGTGPSLLLVLWDEHPSYGWMDTSRGSEWVNTKMFTLKSLYRSWTRGGHKIHTTNSPEETRHDLSLLIGKNAEDWLAAAPQAWDGNIQEWKHDLIGAWGWDSFQQLFYILNNTSSYVLMRGEEWLVGRKIEGHGDVDILTDDYDNLALLVNGTPSLNTVRPHYLTKVGANEVYLDLWNTSMRYEDPKWSKAIFRNKQSKDGMFVMDTENAFYHLLYHVFFHKPQICTDYVPKMEHMARELHIEWTEKELQDNLLPTDKYFHRLMSYLGEQGYSITTPLDSTIQFNDDTACAYSVCERIKELYGMDEVRPVMLNVRRTSGFRYYVGYGNGKKYFIKWGGHGDSARNEYLYSKKLYDVSPDCFLKPHYYRYTNDEKLIVMEYFEGESLENFMKSDKLSPALRENLIVQMHAIVSSLRQCRFVHRDIRPANFAVSHAGNRLVLLDNQFMVNADNYEEMEIVRRNPYWFMHLGADYAFGCWQWDDMFSTSKLMKEIASNEVSDATFSLIQEVESWIGEMRINLEPPRKPGLLKRVIRKLACICSKILRYCLDIRGFLNSGC